MPRVLYVCICPLPAVSLFLFLCPLFLSTRREEWPFLPVRAPAHHPTSQPNPALRTCRAVRKMQPRQCSSTFPGIPSTHTPVAFESEQTKEMEAEIFCADPSSVHCRESRLAVCHSFPLRKSCRNSLKKQGIQNRSGSYRTRVSITTLVTCSVAKRRVIRSSSHVVRPRPRRSCVYWHGERGW